jgi:hypothetical protein
MLSIAFLMYAALNAATPAPLVTKVEHQGTQYEVTYQPHVRARMRTIGMSAGPRPSTERCLWSAELQVSRSVQGVAAADKLLSATRTIEGSHLGNCRFVREQVAADRAKKLARLEAEVAQLAANDRPVLLSEMAAVRAVAAN